MPKRPPPRQPARTTGRPSPPQPGPPGSTSRDSATHWQRTVRYVWDKGGSKGGR